MTNILDQISYNHWANLTLIHASAKLGTEGLMKIVTSSFPSVRQTLIHMLWAEKLWLERWQSRSFIPTLNSEDYKSFDLIESEIEDLYEKQIKFLKDLKPGDENQNVSYLNFQGERWEYSLQEMIQHLLLHSAYHRGQLVTILRQLGLIPPSTDYLVYVDEKSKMSS
jgi:uncharacterized damage-inducible protein DinB